MIFLYDFSFHAMASFFNPTSHSVKASLDFDNYLRKTCAADDSSERKSKLVAWQSEPSASACHPRAEHLAPLFVVVGAAAEDSVTEFHHGQLLNHYTTSFAFGIE